MGLETGNDRGVERMRMDQDLDGGYLGGKGGEGYDEEDVGIIQVNERITSLLSHSWTLG